MTVAVCEQVVIRTVTIMSITKEKQIADQSIQNSSQLEGIPTRVAHQLHDAFQIRSANAQVTNFIIASFQKRFYVRHYASTFIRISFTDCSVEGC